VWGSLVVDQFHGRVVRQGEVPLDQHSVADGDGNLVRRGIGEHLGVHAIVAARVDVHPLRAAPLHHEHQRRGIGSLLLQDLITRARCLGHHVIIAGIDAEQAGSVALHTRFQFAQVGYLKQVGFKFGRWLDVIYMELILDRAVNR